MAWCPYDLDLDLGFEHVSMTFLLDRLTMAIHRIQKQVKEHR
jgi:hypothetical protein